MPARPKSIPGVAALSLGVGSAARGERGGLVAPESRGREDYPREHRLRESSSPGLVHRVSFTGGFVALSPVATLPRRQGFSASGCLRRFGGTFLCTKHIVGGEDDTPRTVLPATS